MKPFFAGSSHKMHWPDLGSFFSERFKAAASPEEVELCKACLTLSSICTSPMDSKVKTPSPPPAEAFADLGGMAEESQGYGVEAPTEYKRQRIRNGYGMEILKAPCNYIACVSWAETAHDPGRHHSGRRLRGWDGRGASILWPSLFHIKKKKHFNNRIVGQTRFVPQFGCASVYFPKEKRKAARGKPLPPPPPPP